jgi:hypothetical protein
MATQGVSQSFLGKTTFLLGVGVGKSLGVANVRVLRGIEIDRPGRSPPKLSSN